MTNREKLNSMTDEEFAEWLCLQLWADYKTQYSDPIGDAFHYHAIRNFLNREYKEEHNAKRPLTP